MENLQESITNVNEISNLLGKPVSGMKEVTDEDLENEFMEFTTLEAITEVPPHVSEWDPPHAVPVVELRTAIFERC